MTNDRRGVAVITGAGSGLGAAMARQLAGGGFDVAVLDINHEHAERMATELREAGARAIAAAADVSSSEAIALAVERVERELGACHILCANVGVQQFGALDSLTSADWQWVLSTNVMGNINTVTAFLPLLRRSTGRRHIVFTSSVATLVPSPRQGAYITSKFAITGYADVLRQELAPEGIGVLTIFPAGMLTTHLESSIAARPTELGTSEIRPDDIKVVIETAVHGPNDMLPPDEAIDDLLAHLDAGHPYLVTHGGAGPKMDARHAELRAAYHRMETHRAEPI